MFNSCERLALEIRKPSRLIVGLFLSLGLSISGFYPVFAQKAGNQTSRGSTPSSSKTLITSPGLTNNPGLRNGVYLYGQTAQPEQIKQEYFVFELQNNRVVGAFYMPRSSFDCFQGTLNAGELHLTIVDSYDADAHPYSLKLQDYQPMSVVSRNERRILGTCKTVYQAKARKEF